MSVVKLIALRYVPSRQRMQSRRSRVTKKLPEKMIKRGMVSHTMPSKEPPQAWRTFFLNTPCRAWTQVRWRTTATALLSTLAYTSKKVPVLLKSQQYKGYRRFMSNHLSRKLKQERQSNWWKKPSSIAHWTNISRIRKFGPTWTHTCTICCFTNALSVWEREWGDWTDGMRHPLHRTGWDTVNC